MKKEYTITIDTKDSNLRFTALQIQVALVLTLDGAPDKIISVEEKLEPPARWSGAPIHGS